MKRILSFLVLAVLCCAPSIAKKKKVQPKPTTPPAFVHKGLFDVTKSGSDWFFYIPDSLLNKEILVTVRYTSTPANTGKYGGEMANQQTVYFQKVAADKMILRSRLLINTADSTDAINRAVIISNEDPIIGSFKIEGTQHNKYKINVSGFFLEDSQAIGVTSGTKQSMGLQALQSSLSYIESIKTFPMNTEVRTVKTWTSNQRNSYAASYTGKVTLGLNVSLCYCLKIR